MLLLISPAKSMNEQIQAQGQRGSLPQFIDQAKELVSILKNFSPEQIGNLMKISDKLAYENYQRYQNWDENHTSEYTKIASLLFQGDVYKGLKAQEFDDADFGFAQTHLRILSGLYGVLRPLDLIFPYRLEMGTKLAHSNGKNLYEFWGQKIAVNINRELLQHTDKKVINLASQEYFKVLGTKNLHDPVITPVFKDYKNGTYKVISFYAKKARGLMASFAIKNKIENSNDLKAFDEEGYQFSVESSSETQWVFLRES